MMSPNNQRILAACFMALILSACAAPQTITHTPATWVDRCNPAISSLASEAGQEWLREHGWRYANQDEALKAYTLLVQKSSPWPDWFEPRKTILPRGTRFQMVLSKDQPTDRPGGYGTFDNIATLVAARDYLAIRTDWKPTLSKIVIYEVTKPIPVNIGPIAAQVDPQTCRLLAGKWSQIEFLVPPRDRMNYMRPIEERNL